MNLSEISIKNPVFAWMLMIGLIFFGLISFKGMGVGQMPDVDFPVLTIQVDWEGAAPEVMETDVVDIIEDSIMGVQGIQDISSSSRQGTAQITIEFELERDIDIALQEVQSKISEIQRRLPRDIDPPVITKANPEDQPIMWLAVSMNADRPIKDLMEFVDRSLKDRFKTIEGVGEVFLGGYVDRNLRVWLDTKKLEAYQMTVSDITSAIQSEHVESPAGELETSQKEASVRAMGEARSVEEFEKIMISRRGGQPIYRPIQLKEVARIEDGLADIRRMSRVNGKPAVGLGIRKQRGANTVAVAHKVKERLKELQKELPSDFSLGINFDSTKFIEDSVHELIFTLILSALLTSFVCWIFLGSWSSTMNILFAIPTSILGTFIIMKFSHFTMNTFTLLGLSLAIGIVVDDAIMVLENIVRHRELGDSQVDAALKGSKEITFAAIAATISIAAIFLPVIYMKGIIGKFFFQFGITITAAVMLSLLEALTLAPMRCSQFLEIGERKDPFGRWFEGVVKKTVETYRTWLIVALRHRGWVITGSIVFFIGSLMFFPLLRKEFVPAQDQSMFLTRIQTPIGSSMEFTNSKFKEIEALLINHPALVRYYGAVGGFGGSESNAGNLFVTLKQPKDRPKDPKTGKRYTQDGLITEFREKFKAIKDAKVIFQDLSTRGFSAKRGSQIEFTIRGPNWDKLVEYSEKIEAEMKKSDLFQDVDSDYLSGMPEVRVFPDRDKAFARGVSISSITETINAAIGGSRVAKYTREGRRYDVRVRLEAEQRMKADDILKLAVWNNRGERVQMKDVIRLEERPTLLRITRNGRERAIGLFSSLGHGKSESKAIEKAREITRKIVPDGYRVVFTGTSATSRESAGSLGFALLLGIIVAYMVLASQFNHVVHPFTVLLALPYSLSGAILALWATGLSLNIFSMIGVLLLMGIVKKNSILLVEFTNQLREQGQSPLEAIKNACPIRFRPILMTTVSTIAAAIPPALALGPGAETRIPMAVVIIGGVLVSTILTLFVIPCAYYVFVPFESHGTAMEYLRKSFPRWLTWGKKSVSQAKQKLEAGASSIKKRLPGKPEAPK